MNRPPVRAPQSRRFLFLEAELDLVARLGRHLNGDFAVSM
jgi:hypothetical protein